ncbi:MAG: NADPH:quinone reductase, partial [Rhodospirillaceae bacterium]|nr:NADPH:quinone reductase [Rhodospirillaceae bacterium]
YFRRLGAYLQSEAPLILGHDGAGVVEAIGPRVTQVKPGDAVCFCYGGIGGDPGTYAEFAVVRDELLVPKPESIDFTTAAALPLVAITLGESLFERARLRSGEHVLIHAGAGGTGHVGIQFARIAGARVATTVSTSAKAELAAELGAERPILYRQEDFVGAAREWTADRGLDVLLDNVGPEVLQQSLRAMAYYGRVVTLMGTPADDAEGTAYNANLTIHNVMMLTPMWRGLRARLRRQTSHVRNALTWIAEGKLRVIVDRVFPLADAAAAHRHLESGKAVGKVVLAM